jgi:hypothetical protein
MRVDSSLIRSVTYETDATLTVRFRDGTAYRYFTVPPTVLDQFLTATSKGPPCLRTAWSLDQNLNLDKSGLRP